MKTKCKKCGTDLYEGVIKCPTCGYSESEELATLKKYAGTGISRDDKKKLIKYGIGLLILCGLFYHFFLYVDIGESCFITLKPSLEFSNTSIKKGIRYLKKNYPAEYTTFCTNVSSINPNTSCGGFGGGCYSSYRKGSPRTIDISTAFGNYHDAAKVIVHETCHAIQFKEKRPFDEAECHAKDEIIPWQWTLEQ